MGSRNALSGTAKLVPGAQHRMGRNRPAASVCLAGQRAAIRRVTRAWIGSADYPTQTSQPDWGPSVAKMGSTHVRKGAKWPLSCRNQASASRLMSAIEQNFASNQKQTLRLIRLKVVVSS
jgi:hypothetical protein